MNEISMKQLTSVASFDQRFDAEVLKTELRTEGIAAEIKDETNLQRFWFFVSPKAAFHVLVPKDSLERTLAFLKREPEAAYLRNAVRCPSCKSCQVDYPAVTRKNLLPALVNRILAAFHILPQKYYCEHCHYSWVAGQSHELPQGPQPATTPFV